MKEHTKIKTGKWALSIFLGIASWTFFAVFYRFHLHYEEQLQLFQATSSYFLELMSFPGGLAIWLGRFITQFFYDSTLGALFISLLLIILQILVADQVKYMRGKNDYYLLTFMPSLFYWILLCNENILLSGLIAFILSLLVVSCYNRINKKIVRLFFLFILTPVLYWLVGYAAFLLPVIGFLAFYLKKEYSAGQLALLAGGTILLIIVIPLSAKIILVHYPLSRLWLAGDYFRYIWQYSSHFYIIIAYLSVLGVILLIRWLPEIKNKKNVFVSLSIQFLILIIFIILGISKVSDWEKEEVMAYDHYARMQKWYHILSKADKKAPDGPLTVSILNLALCQTGNMPDHMFEYYQNGIQGLLPEFQKDYILLAMVGEVYYHMGLVNTAQRFAFEAMETLPDYQKSVRSIKRLAETNLVNEQYDVAEKYLKILSNTLFYKKWAKETLLYISKPERIDQHPEWSALRQCRPKEDFLFSEKEKDMMCGLLFQENYENRIAYEYLLSYTLLSKDLQRFLTYYRLGEDIVSYRVIPKSYQEALLYIWSITNNDPARTIPYPISDSVKKRLDAYRNIYTANPNAKALLQSQFGDTYWYYLHF